jgi:hypothetical protein
MAIIAGGHGINFVGMLEGGCADVDALEREHLLKVLPHL